MVLLLRCMQFLHCALLVQLQPGAEPQLFRFVTWNLSNHEPLWRAASNLKWHGVAHVRFLWLGCTKHAHGVLVALLLGTKKHGAYGTILWEI